MTRYECLQAIAKEVGDAVVVAASAAYREWDALRPGPANMRCRTLGLVSSIGLGIALSLPRRKVMVLDGDGALLMNLCGLPTIAWQSPGNLIHIVFDNQVYEASGATATATAAGTDLVEMARGAGYRRAVWARSVEEFRQEVLRWLQGNQLTFIGAKVPPGREPVPASDVDEVELKYRFMRHIQESEGVPVFRGTF